MEISGIRNTFPFMFPGKDVNETSQNPTGDVVDVHAPAILADEDVDSVFNETLSMISNDPAAALAVHSGLNENRVFALLGL